MKEMELFGTLGRGNFNFYKELILIQNKMDDRFSDLITFISKYYGKYDFPLKKETTIQDEMGITGIDGVYFILEYGKQFNVDVSNFMAADYFDPDGAFLPFKFPFLKYLSPRSKSKDLTLHDLENGITAGKLDDTIIGNPPPC